MSASSSSTSPVTTDLTAATSGVQLNLSAALAALKDIAFHPEKAAVDGSGQLILKDAADIAGIVGDIDPGVKPIAAGLSLAAMAEPTIAKTIEAAIALGDAWHVDVNALLQSKIAERFGTTDAPHLEKD